MVHTVLVFNVSCANPVWSGSLSFGLKNAGEANVTNSYFGGNSLSRLFK